jgi:hypothetical protein
MMRRVFFVTFVLIAACALQCAKDYNPYENSLNAQVLVAPDSCSFDVTGDTVPVFTTHTVALYTVVREKIDSFSLHADHNRYWTDTTIRPPFKKASYLFSLSFYDTGKTTIAITTHRTNREDFSMTPPISLVVRSPLAQKDIMTTVGAPCTLSTPALGDRDIYYYWSFVSDTIKSPFSNNPEEYPDITMAGTIQTGMLWVADTLGRYQSPATPFTFYFTQPNHLNTSHVL